MLAVFLKILSILGIILLVLFLIILVIALLVLFVPVVYRADGRKDSENMEVHARASWLFGFLRVMAQYSSGFQLKVKLLCFTLFDIEDDLPDTEKTAGTEPFTGEEAKSARRSTTAESTEETKSKEVSDAENKTASEPDTNTKIPDGTSDEEKSGFFDKYEKIKCKIQDIHDKIKDVSENLDYYKSILEEKESKDLFKYVFVRLGKVLKALKPKKCMAEVLFGTGAPDTTGYAFGLYGMLSPHLGNDILVTPDFTRAVLEGNFALSGHIMIFTVLIQGICVIMDRRFHMFMDKMKHK